jgi:hypothetical protein
MTEVDLFGRTFRTPIPPPPGHILAPICAAVIVVGGFVRPDLGPQIEAIVRGSRARLERAVAETDRLDPHWRMADLLKHRKEIPDEHNAARKADEVIRLLPVGWGNTGPGQTRVEIRLVGDLIALPLDAEPDDEQVELMQTVLDPVAQAVQSARELAGMPEGRHEIIPARNPLETPLKETQQTRTAARLLLLDAYRRVHEGDAEGGVESCRALLNTARAIGDEPFLPSQLVRLANDGSAIRAIERVQSQGEPSDTALAGLQSALAGEAETPWMLIALRGERAMFFDLVEKLASGELTAADLSSEDPGSDRGREPASWATPDFYRHNQALGLERLNRAIEIAQEPLPDWTRLWQRWQAEIRPPDDPAENRADTIVSLLLPEVSFFAQAEVGARARLRAAVLLTASTRYKLAHGNWPEAASDLVPEFLAEVPADPFTGDPMRLVQRDGDLVAYALGTDRADDGGNLHPMNESTIEGFDVGAQLSDFSRHTEPTEAVEQPPERP